MADWRDHLLESDEAVDALLARVQTVAVLGIKMEPDAPAYYVPAYVQGTGRRIIPVPVYYPDATEILGERVYRRVSDIPERVDLVNVFRRSKDVAGHLEDLLTAKPRAVWMQSGIRDDAVAEELAKAGIDVVQDWCLMVALRLRGM